MNRSYYYLLVFSLTIFSCKRIKRERKDVFYTRDHLGNVLSKMPYYINPVGDTIIDGYVVSYFSNLKIKDSFRMNNGKRSGIYLSYDSFGNLRRFSFLFDDKLEGISKYYFPNGQIKSEHLYRNDSLLYGKDFFSNGQFRQYFIYTKPKSDDHPLEAGYLLVYDSLGNKLNESGDSILAKRW